MVTVLLTVAMVMSLAAPISAADFSDTAGH